jgi:VIT1/CCC1 family predicted Fe2+/Mn2+ transporter
MALLGQYLRAGAAFLIGGAIGSLPFVFNSPYFMPAVGLVVVVGLILGWLQFRKPPCPDAAQESKEG